MKAIASLALAWVLSPALVFAEAEMRGTVIKVDEAEKQIVLKTEKGEETLLLVSGSKGISHAKEGARVAVKFTEKDGQPKVIEVTPQPVGTLQVLPH